ncbi:hypothetical protein ACQ86N_08410 [Puia sp. P3]|uniref:hypothetical protein n=1 Tax=Puia sp. P3 TaxID=3423952 RepID=UPI003D677EF8
MNTLFKRGKDSRKVFSDPKYWGFDEFNFKHFLIDQEHSVWDVETEIETFTLIVRNAQKSGEIQAHFDFICLEGSPW